MTADFEIRHLTEAQRHAHDAITGHYERKAARRLRKLAPHFALLRGVR